MLQPVEVENILIQQVFAGQTRRGSACEVLLAVAAVRRRKPPDRPPGPPRPPPCTRIGEYLTREPRSGRPMAARAGPSAGRPARRDGRGRRPPISRSGFVPNARPGWVQTPAAFCGPPP